MANPFDQFDSNRNPNPFDRFDKESQGSAPEQKKDKSFLEWVGNDLTGLANNNTRGSIIGGAAQGAADLGAGAVQFAANALGIGDAVNKRISEKEKEYQSARAAAGRDGFDAARLAGNVAMSAPLGSVGSAASLSGRVALGAAQGAAYGAATPVATEGDYWSQKAKDMAGGAVMGGAMAPVAGAIGRLISPKANSADVKLLQQEGVRLTPGQVAGGVWARAEEKLQSVPFLGDAITAARTRGVEDLNRAALKRTGVAVDDVGESAIAAAKKQLGAQYDNIIPQLQLDASNAGLTNRLANLRNMVQSLPEREAKAFDDVIAREIDARIAPNGVLSGQNLKDALASIRDKGTAFSRSPDAYQADLGRAYKQLHRELLDEMMATNGAAGQALKATDRAYANFKRAERAQSAVGNAGEAFTPAQLYNAVKALDKSKDKSQFASGGALMQDLAGAGKRVLGNSVPDSGTAGRVLATGGLVGAGMYNPLIPVAAAAGSVAYKPAVQNAIVKLLSREGGAKAQAVANKLRELLPIAGSAAVLSQ